MASLLANHKLLRLRDYPMVQDIPRTAELKSEKVQLTFCQPAQTSRNTLIHRDIWILSLGTWKSECAPLPGLSPDWISEKDWEKALSIAIQEFNTKISNQLPNSVQKDWEPWLDQWRINYPSIAFGLENMLQKIYAFHNPEDQNPFPTEPKKNNSSEDRPWLRINGLIWMNDLTTMRKEAMHKVAQGFDCLKFKIGILDWQAELDMIAEIRSDYHPANLEIRVDANGALHPDRAVNQMMELQSLGIHSIEQPLHPRFDHLITAFSKAASLPIALDESILLRKPDDASHAWLAESGVKFLVLKPGLLGGFKVAEAWIQIAEELGIGWWITSALESNIGLGTIASWTYHQVLRWGNPLAQGLGTGRLYVDNFPATTLIREGRLYPVKDWSIS